METLNVCDHDNLYCLFWEWWCLPAAFGLDNIICTVFIHRSSSVCWIRNSKVKVSWEEEGQARVARALTTARVLVQRRWRTKKEIWSLLIWTSLGGMLTSRVNKGVLRRGGIIILIFYYKGVLFNHFGLTCMVLGVI